MVETLAITAYSLTGIVTARLTAGHLAWYWVAQANRRRRARYGGYHADNNYDERPSGDHWLGGACLGLLCGAVWPILVAVFATNKLPFTAGAERAALQEKREKALQSRIRELEENTGV